jgi:hypothetical protein
MTNPDAVSSVATNKRGGRPSSNTSGRVSRRAISARLVDSTDNVFRPPKEHKTTSRIINLLN